MTQPELIALSILLTFVALAFICGGIIYAAMIVGARSEPKEEYYLIITKSTYKRKNKEKGTQKECPETKSSTTSRK